MPVPVVLLLHGSRFGQSLKIARVVGEQLAARGIAVDLQPLTVATAPDPAKHGALALVTSVRYGHFDRNAGRLVARHRAWLDAVPTLFVTVSLTARTAAKRDPAVHVYTRKFLAKTGWAPGHTEVVAGALEYPRYKLWDRLAIRLIMHMTHGPTDPTTVIEYTDWDQVRRCADAFADRLTTDRPAHG